MKRSAKLRQNFATLRKRAEAILAAADPETGALSTEQAAQYQALRTEMETLEASIRREDELEASERIAPSVETRPADAAAPRVTVTRMRDNAAEDSRRGFRSHREFLNAVMANSRARSLESVRDERLRPLALVDADDQDMGEGMTFLLPEAWTPRGLSAAAGADEQGNYSDPYGGFATPRAILPGVLSVGFEGDPLAGRTTPVPMEAPIVDILARTDKNHTTSVSGGLTVTRRPETVAATGARQQMEAISLKATALFGLGYATEEILADSPISFIALLEAGFRDQFGAHLLNEKIRGTGGSEYLGLLNSPALVTVAAEGGQSADTIQGLNIIKMRSRCWGYGMAVWLANHDTLPELAKAHLAGTNASVFLFAPGNGVDKPDTLLGRPVFFTEFASTIGDVGDLILVNPTQYLEGLYQPLQSAESVHVRFINHERTMKFWVRNAGAPWWRSALTPNKSATTLSPIVTLAAR